MSSNHNSGRQRVRVEWTFTSAQLEEVRQRIAEVESGEAELIPGDEVSARVQRLLETRLADREVDS